MCLANNAPSLLQWASACLCVRVREWTQLVAFFIFINVFAQWFFCVYFCIRYFVGWHVFTEKLKFYHCSCESLLLTSIVDVCLCTHFYSFCLSEVFVCIIFFFLSSGTLHTQIRVHSIHKIQFSCQHCHNEKFSYMHLQMHNGIFFFSLVVENFKRTTFQCDCWGKSGLPSFTHLKLMIIFN